MDLIVKRSGTVHTLDWGAGARTCAVGRAGVGEKRGEGDGLTPKGVFALRRVLYRPDRLDAPKTMLAVEQIEPDDGWCDAASDANYNRLVKLPYPASAENLWRADGLYDVVVVVGYNDAPVVKGMGSAIFLHVAKPDYAPTEGCVALKREDLLEALVQLKRGDRLRIEN